MSLELAGNAALAANIRNLQVELSAPDQMVLGKIAPSLDIISFNVDRRRTHVQNQAKALPAAEQAAFLKRYDLMNFSEYQEAVKAATRPRLGYDGSAIPAIAAFLERYNPKLHVSNLDGWVQYICEVAPPFAEIFEVMGSVTTLPESVRQMHTLITAASGWGKSELLKALVHHYVVHDMAAVVVLDPHGDMAPQIAKWLEFRGKDRLIYIEPELEKGQTVGLNPLDARGLDPHGIAVLGDQLGVAIGELSSDLTGNMEMVARGCARLLLEDGNASLFDLLDLLENPPKGQAETPTQRNRARLIAKGRQHRDPIMQRFFYGRIEASSLSSAREGIDNRISRLLFLPRFQHMTCGPPTLHLETALNQRKVIVCNLAPLGSAGAAAMGRLIVALVAAIGLRREGSDLKSRVPCHVFVDEAQTMASPAMARILFECRKFGIHLTLAQQVEGVGFDDVGQKALANSTATKFVGANVPAALKGVFAGQDVPESAPLKRRQFWMRWGQGGEPTRIEVRPDLADDSNAISAREWEAVKQQQIKRHYRDAEEKMPAAPINAPGVQPQRSPEQPPSPPKKRLPKV